MSSLTRLLDVPIERVQGLSGRRGGTLRRAGIANVADLLLHIPRRYVDRSKVVPLTALPLGEEITVIVTVLSASTRRPRRNLTVTEARVTDGTSTLKVVWFNQLFRQRQLAAGAEVALSGKVEVFRGSRQMPSPAVDVLSGDGESLVTARIVPIHPAIGEVGPGHMRRAVHNALKRSRPIPDPLPADLVARLDLVSRDTAFATIHFPESLEQVAGARRRLAFDELFRLEVALAVQKQRIMDEARGISHPRGGSLAESFLAGLPFSLTDAQVRVLGEIQSDLASVHPMHRLLQGEVGSGKTVVAVAAILAGIQGGYQAAIMAPTEVLAAQHYLNLAELLELAGLAPAHQHLGMPSLFSRPAPSVRLALLTSSQAAANFDDSAGREDIKASISSGEVDLVVGTHALIQNDVDFARLGVVVVDEQHRFGVGQRVKLKDKASDLDPDVLIMTATPIPRTLSMTLYGDLDVSLLDQMPPGRTPVETVAVSEAERERAYTLIREEVAAGRQAFVVCPLVEESEKIEAASATAELQRLDGVFPDLRLGLIHGQLPAKEKQAVMDSFRAGQIDVLVATTVIEVGIDIPNATVMLIEDAGRFGLSQLHQLRGRVGRAGHRSTCILVANPTTAEGEARITAMLETNDGFRLAEEDLRIRGQGTVFGHRQSGVADLRVADLLTDLDLLLVARREAFGLVAADPRLTLHEEIREEVLAVLGERVEWLFVS